MPSPPKAPPRTKKSDIGVPFNFVHVNHVGTDFRSEDVKRALRPMADNLVINENERCSVYEKVSHPNLETPIMAPAATSPIVINSVEDIPEMAAPLYEPYSPTTSTEQFVPHYENISVSSSKQKKPVNSNPVRPSKKKYPPPPPPSGQKPRLQRDDAMEESTVAVVLRREKEAVPIPVLPEPVNATPQIMEAPRISVVVDRPQMLDIRIHLDDKIPIQEGVSSKYRTPSMLTPSPQKAQHREMAVDVPIEYHISNTKRKAPEPPLKVPNIIKELQAQITQGMTNPPATEATVISNETKKKKEKTRPNLNDIYMQSGSSKDTQNQADNYVVCGTIEEKTRIPVQLLINNKEVIPESKAEAVEVTERKPEEQKRMSIEVAPQVVEEPIEVPKPSEEIPKIEEAPAPVPRPRTRKSLSTEYSQENETTPVTEEIQPAKPMLKLEVVRTNKKKKNLSIVTEVEERNDENEKENNAEDKETDQHIIEKEAWSVDSEAEDDENVIRL